MWRMTRGVNGRQRIILVFIVVCLFLGFFFFFK